MAFSEVVGHWQIYTRLVMSQAQRIIDYMRNMRKQYVQAITQ